MLQMGLSTEILTLYLLITFANSLDLDQAQQNIRSDLDPELFDTENQKLML